MSLDEDETDRLTPVPHRRRGDITLEDRLEMIEQTLHRLVEKLSDGTNEFSSLRVRIRALEFVVYGSCGIVGTGVIGSLLYLVLKGGPAGHP